MLPLLRQVIVEEKNWFSDDEYVDIMAVCQTLPGVIAVNLATYVGYKKKGFPGSVIATVGVVLPSYIIIILIAKGFAAFDNNPYLGGAMAGLRAAALGLVVVALIQLATTIFNGKWSVIIAVLSFVMIAIIKINTVYVILLFIMLGAIRAIVAEKNIKKIDTQKVVTKDLQEGESENITENGKERCQK